ncbi:hypothetical protein K491DRAFT_610426 [Lophiostoma macrostomum CBS 122681]|uniref:Zn(2)-C6 fungal-type domain-containing protein n=1 Tax=Lophiostoma macrostomum CBS 122681 TaxID=1314788 RepID=A0A6A6STU1_9PLEO|nr:hypothetical protein K491DRAFT_610426 [Lophiostoma macrostomum CBS 122681]
MRSLSRTKQKHVTTACLNCRTRKIKCDARTPSCSNCVLYSQQCVYQHGLDKRKIPIKDRLVSIETYARQLEDLLTVNGIPLPHDRVLNSTPAADGSSTGSEAFHAIRGYTSSAETLGEPHVAPDPFLVAPYPLPAEGSSPLVDQLAGNLGSLQIAEDGQLRFYGATSNLHLLVKGARKSINTHMFADPEEIQATLEAVGVGQHVDAEFEQHLIKLYFCWEDPSIHLVQEDVFYRERRRCKAEGIGTSKFYSEVLVNAMCAVGAALTSRHCVELPESLVDFFSLRARALLDIELDSPTLSTVQSLGILSGVESIRTLDARGWLYSGMAVRLATDLGLHLDTQAYLNAGVLDVEEALVRRVLFWGVFIHERMWSLYLGRPVSLDEKAITTPPYRSSTNEPKYWQPYVDEFEDSDFPALLDPIEDFHRQNATLCSKMTRIRETLYSDSAASVYKAQGLHDFTSSMRTELQNWHAGLNDNLVVDLSAVSSFYVPHVLQLHMQYHTVMILANRPFFSADISRLPDVAFSDPMVGRPACTESAKAISKLLQIYRRLYSFRRINIQAVHLIFTASLIHVLNACQAAEPSLKNSAWKDLEVCCQALSEMGKGYKNASRALEVVSGIKSELLKTTRENAKRASMAFPETEDVLGSKRRRSSGVPAGQRPEIRDPEPDTILDPSMNAIDSIFWSELTSLGFPGLNYPSVD